MGLDSTRHQDMLDVAVSNLSSDTFFKIRKYFVEVYKKVVNGSLGPFKIISELEVHKTFKVYIIINILSFYCCYILKVWLLERSCYRQIGILNKFIRPQKTPKYL